MHAVALVAAATDVGAVGSSGGLIVRVVADAVGEGAETGGASAGEFDEQAVIIIADATITHVAEVD